MSGSDTDPYNRGRPPGALPGRSQSRLTVGGAPSGSESGADSSSKNKKRREKGTISLDKARRARLNKVSERMGDAFFPSNPDDVEELFRIYDVDDGGTLSMDEFTFMINELHRRQDPNHPPLTTRQVGAFMNWVDASGEKEVDMEEFRHFFDEAAHVEALKSALDTEALRAAGQRKIAVGCGLLGGGVLCS